MNIREELCRDGVKRVILDTDTYNEIDDQFALALMLLARDRIDPVCVTAAPFEGWKSKSFADGMEKSYLEIEKCSRLVAESHGVTVPPYYRGSTERMPDPHTPVESEAAHAIARHVMESDEITYVCAIGAITNVASAILLHPEIKEKMAVLWLGGNSRWVHAAEFNVIGDRNAANSIFASDVPLLWFPCWGVVSHLSLTMVELEHFLRGNSPLGDYLCDNVLECRPEKAISWSRVIWDISTVCGIINPWCFDESVQPRPQIAENMAWEWDKVGGTVEHVEKIDRDTAFSIMFDRLMKK